MRRARRSVKGWAAAVILSGAWACQGPVTYTELDEGTPDEIDTPAPDDPARDVTQKLHLSTCEAGLAWEKATLEQVVEQGFFGHSPNRGLLVRMSTYGDRHAYRASDGEPVFALTQNLGRRAMSADWSVYGDLVANDQGQQQMAVKALITERVLESSGLLESFPQVALSGDGGTAVTVSCQRERLQVTRWRVSEGAEVLAVDLGQPCLGPFWPSDTAVSVTSDGAVAVIGLDAEGALARVDLETGEFVVVEAHGAEMDTWGRRVLDLSIQPGGDLVASVGLDGLLRLFALPDMSPVGEPIAAGTQDINKLTYLPSVVSLAVWSPDGRLLAHLSPEGDVILRHAADMAVALELPRPIFDEGQEPEFARNGLVDVAFDAHTQALAISTESGMAMWRCEGAERPQGHGPLQVTLDGPARLRVGQAATFVATHFGTDHLHGHTFFIDGQEAAPSTTARELTWTATAPGRHEVTIVIDDGLDSGSATLQVEVSP